MRASTRIYLMITVAVFSPGFLQGLVAGSDEAAGGLKNHPGSAGTWAASAGFFYVQEVPYRKKTDRFRCCCQE